MLARIRHDDQITAWQIGPLQVARTRERVHVIWGRALNVSVRLSDLDFHAGRVEHLDAALRSLSDVDPP